MLFRTRIDAGARLAAKLGHLRDRDPVILALPRGGVPVAWEIARALGAPLDVLVARKLGAPGQPELGIGAIAEGDTMVVDDRTVRALGVTKQQLARIAEIEEAELARRVRTYRGDREPLDIAGRTVVIVDDGLATGVTARAAIASVRRREPAYVVLASPVCAPATASALRQLADEVVCVSEPAELHAVGVWYDDFSQLFDEEVHAILKQAWRVAPGTLPPPMDARRADPPTGRHLRLVPAHSEWQQLPLGDPRRVAIDVGHGVTLDGTLAIPEPTHGVVIFAHGSGSNSRSPRNAYVAYELQRAGLATLLVDLLSTEEQAIDESTRHLRFDVPLLADRLGIITDWVIARYPQLAVGYFGASTGAAAAIQAATRYPDRVRAIVSRGGRPDLAGDALPLLRAPTLLVVGSDDESVLALNRQAVEAIGGVAHLETVPGATHLFDEPGAIREVAHRAAGWLLTYLSTASLASRTESA